MHRFVNLIGGNADVDDPFQAFTFQKEGHLLSVHLCWLLVDGSLTINRPAMILQNQNIANSIAKFFDLPQEFPFPVWIAFAGLLKFFFLTQKINHEVHIRLGD